MIVEYENGKMIVTHASEHVDIYNRTDYEVELARQQLKATKLQESITETEDAIKAIDASA